MTRTTAPLSSTAAADALIPSRHPFAAHLRHVAERDAAEPLHSWTPDDGALPALYLSHGAPPTFEDGPWMRQLHDWARTLPKPKAILIVSAHWESDSLGITSTAPTELVYDFGGFDPMYYRMRYDTPDPTPLAHQVRPRSPPPSRFTSTATAAWTTAPGSPSRSCTPCRHPRPPAQPADHRHRQALRPRPAPARPPRRRGAGRGLRLHDPRPALHRLEPAGPGTRLVSRLRRLGR